MTLRARRFALLVTGATTAAGLSLPARADTHCSDAVEGTFPTEAVPALAGYGTGRYALPSATAPTRLVVFAHGYRNTSASWEPHLRAAAGGHGAIAFALDYRGTGYTGLPGDNRGWFVKVGAEDSIQAARYFLGRCPSIERVAILGISMGGNMSGLAVAAQAKRLDGSTPLFDYWVDVEGVANMTETYLEATAVASTSPYVQGAKDDIEFACGGTLWEEPDCYREHTVLARVPEIVGADPQGVVIVHGVDDGLVPYDQSRELATALGAGGVALDFFTVLRRNDWQNPGSRGDEGGTTLSSNFVEPLPGVGPYWSRPLAGHGWEGSTTHIVIRTGFDRLWRLLDAAAPAVGPYREFTVDSELGITPDPDA